MKIVHTKSLCWAGLCLAFAVCLSLLGRPSRVVVRSDCVEAADSAPLRLRIHLPAGGADPAPAVIICPPLGVSAHVFHMMATEVAENGMVCAVLDLFGEKPDESRQRLKTQAVDAVSMDLQNAVAYVAALPIVDPSRIGLVGHSFGATAALDVAMRSRGVRATVMIGMAGDMTPDSPRNVLLIAGLYDELHSRGSLLESLRSATGIDDPSACVLLGRFSDGTARRLVEVATISHCPEVVHPGLIREIVDWLAMAFDRPLTKERTSYSLRACAQWGAWIAAMCSLVILSCGLCGTAAFRAFVLLGVPLAYAWSVSGIWPAVPRAGVLFFALPCVIAGPVIGGEAERLRKRMRRLCINCAAIYAAYCLTLIANNVWSYVCEPRFMLRIPLFPFVNGFLWIVYLGTRVTALLGHLMGHVGLQAAGALLCIGEAVKPGLVLGAAWAVAERLRCRPSGGATSRRNKIVFVVLLVILVVALWRRFREGLLTAGSLSAAVGVALRLALPMLVLFLLIRRVAVTILARGEQTAGPSA